MSFESKAHPPVIPSQLSAKLKVEQWNSYQNREIYDADGLVWKLHIHKRQLPDPSSRNQLIWEITLQLKTQASLAALLATKTLDPQSDSRLIELLADASLPFALKPFAIRAGQEEEANKLASHALTDYIQKFQKESLKLIKRQLIGRFIDNNLQFNTYE